MALSTPRSLSYGDGKNALRWSESGWVIGQLMWLLRDSTKTINIYLLHFAANVVFFCPGGFLVDEIYSVAIDLQFYHLHQDGSGISRISEIQLL